MTVEGVTKIVKVTEVDEYNECWPRLVSIMLTMALFGKLKESIFSDIAKN